MPHRPHPSLDLTRQIFTSNWWLRVSALGALLAILSLIMFNFSETPKLSARTKLELRTLAKTLPAPASIRNVNATDLAVAYGAPSALKDFSHRHAARQTLTLRKGDTLGDILMNAGLSGAQSYSAAKSLDRVVPLRTLRPGKRINISLAQGSGATTLEMLSLKADFKTIAQVKRTSSGTFEAELLELEVSEEQVFHRGEISSSLYLAAEAADIPAAAIVETIRALSYRVDFQREIRPGDAFEILYTNSAASDGSARTGAVEFAMLDLGDRVEKLYRFIHPKTRRADYFDAKGESMRRLLMRTPIDGARLTSSFGKRRHPVLGYVRSHQGVDFGAPTGTPIYAAGDGTVKRSNRFGSYGNYVLIQHAKGFKTAYAHLSRFARGMKAGKRVRQGDIIGYVGATGRVTGPHLHYEVYRGKTRVNPMRLDLPTGESLSGDALARFENKMAEIDKRRMLAVQGVANVKATHSAQGAR